MERKGTTPSNLAQRVAEFEQENPKIAEAMALFHIGLNEYQKALNALHGPQVYLSASSIPKGISHNAK